MATGKLPLKLEVLFTMKYMRMMQKIATASTVEMFRPL